MDLPALTTWPSFPAPSVPAADPSLDLLDPLIDSSVTFTPLHPSPNLSVPLDGAWNLSLLDQCYSPYFESIDGNLLTWNQSLIDELQSRGCNCTEINLANHIGNLVCPEQVLEHSWWVQAIYIFLFSTIIALSVCGNFTVIWIVLYHRRMRASITNYFLLNLAVADASISVFNVCFSFTFNLYYDWFFGRAYCTFNNFMGVAPTSASVFTLMTMSLDRYMAIVYPLRRRLSRTKTIVIIVCIWVCSGLCGLPMLMYSRTIEYYLMNGEKDMACLADDYPDGNAQTSYYFMIYNYFLFAVNYVLPLAVLSLTYIRMSMELWGSQRIGDYRHEESVRAKRKVVKMMVTVVSIFMFCWFPYHAYFTVLTQVFTELDSKHAQHLYLNMYFLAMSSTIFNPIIYVWMNSRFRIGFKYAFRWLPCLHITKDEYLESDLHRDRFNVNSSATCRRRSTATTYCKNGAAAAALHNGTTTTSTMASNNSPPSLAYRSNDRRTTSICTQVSSTPVDDLMMCSGGERAAQEIALLDGGAAAGVRRQSVMVCTNTNTIVRNHQRSSQRSSARRKTARTSDDDVAV